MLSEALHRRSLEKAGAPPGSRKLLLLPFQAAQLCPGAIGASFLTVSLGRNPVEVENLRISKSAVRAFLTSLSLSTLFLRHCACWPLPPRWPLGGCEFRWHTPESGGTLEGFCNGKHAACRERPML